MKTLQLIPLVLFSLNCKSQIVIIPDANFKNVLVNENQINTNLDTEIQLSEAIAYAGSIDCSGQGITDLTGIEAFTSLTGLDCRDNALTTINLTQNSALNYLDCEGNLLPTIDVTQNTQLLQLHCRAQQSAVLTSLDVSQNTLLETLDCDENSLTYLDVSQNTSLIALGCRGNQLTSLDVSLNPNLMILDCEQNQLTSLDVSQNPNLTYLDCGLNSLECLNVKNGNNTILVGFDPLNNPNLTCIQVDNVAWSNSNWTWKDPQHYYSTDCGTNCTADIVENTPIEKMLIGVFDIYGREAEMQENTVLILHYSDGTSERVFKVSQ